MSKIIKLTPEQIEQIRKDFDDTLKTARVSDGKVSFTKILGYVNRKATLYFTELAWNKMQALVREFSTEVGWHGTAKRGDDPEKDEYIITDILVPYPQYVTGATVNTEQKEYDMWLFSEENDEVFNSIRFHGHSHVNMATSPSSVDINHWDGIINQLEDDMFYIFAIWNKRGDKTVKIYDFAKNVLFDTTDVEVKVLEDADGMSAFIKAAKERVKEKKYTPVTQYGHNYSGYQQGYPTQSRPVTPTSGKNVPPTAETASGGGKTTNGKTDKKDKKRKGRRKKYSSQLTIYNDGIGGW